MWTTQIMPSMVKPPIHQNAGGERVLHVKKGLGKSFLSSSLFRQLPVFFFPFVSLALAEWRLGGWFGQRQVCESSVLFDAVREDAVAG